VQEEPVGRRLQAVAREGRQEYIGYIGRLAPRDLTPFWWITSLSEKNPNNSDLFLHASYAKLVLESVRSEPCDRIILCETGGLAETIERNLTGLPGVTVERRRSPGKAFLGQARDAAWGIARKLSFIATMTGRILLSRSLGFTRKGKTGEGEADVMIYSWTDARSLA
jgi:hypothetical protein